MPNIDALRWTPRRVLVIDDNHDIHSDFRKTLKPVSQSTPDVEALFFGEGEAESSARVEFPEFLVESADQGLTGVSMVQAAIEAGQRFDLAFVDMRMPPGLDGVETIERLWKLDPHLPVVICTAYSDYTGLEIFERLGVTDRLQILKKPFDPVEVQHLALSLSTRRLLEEQANLHTEELERRVAERTADLSIAKERAEEASRLKGEFLANMSHEIRTPLNGVMGMLELLMESGLNDNQTEYAEVSLSSARSLLALINDILDYSKIEANQLQLDFHPFDLRRTAEEVTAITATQIGDRDVEVVLDFPTSAPSGVIGDSLRIRQVLTNLLSNALKFTQRGCVILEINAIPTPQDCHTFRFSVRDSGIGIQEEQLSYIFGKFAQADSSTTRQYGGTGLGLAICQQLVQMMGGRIHVNSEPGCGSEFTFHLNLPVPVSAVTCRDDHSRESVDLGAAAVLVVDDLEINRRIVWEQLGSVVGRITTVESGPLALNELMLAEERNEPYDLLVVDQQMPVMDGLELTKQIQEIDSLNKPGMVLLSSNSNDLDSDLASQFGFHACLAKPVGRSELVRVLESTYAEATATGDCAVDDTGAVDDVVMAQSNRISVLLADDNEVNRMVGGETLKRLGCAVTLAVDGQEALDALSSRSFAMVFMDCQMPVMDGYEATARIRALDGPAGRVPIVALTANAMIGDREKCLAAGMDDYLPKPFGLQSLQEKLQHWAVDCSASPSS